MSNVKWIKIVVNIFDDEKVRLIETLPDSDSLIVIWFKLLTMAGKCNDCGMVYLTRDIPYNVEMLSTIMRRPANTIRLALSEFRRLGMIDVQNDFIAVINWEKHQNIAGLDKIREQNKVRVNEYRKRLKNVGGYDYQKHYCALLERDGGKCVYCGSSENLVIDHLIPLALGGDNQIDNLVISCRSCNSGKSGRLPDECGYNFKNQGTIKQYEKTLSRVTVLRDESNCHAIDKNRIDKDIDKNKREKGGRFTPPSLLEVEQYLIELGITYFTADTFIDFYASKNWMIGKNKMKDWRAAVRTWVRRHDGETKKAEIDPAERIRELEELENEWRPGHDVQ